MKIKNHINIAKEVIDTEIKALRKLRGFINNSFNLAIKSILNCKGKVIITGVGKSGIIGRKISSTLSSVGTPSFFVNASSCSHGDLGKISSHDILILISYSGETQELKNIIQFAARSNKIKIIGITAKKNSLLYRQSNIKLLIPSVKEAGPGGFVPTSSTMVQLSLGDAIAISTMKGKNFTSIDFKKFHPSGSLGFKLKTVEDLMLTGNKIPFVKDKLLMKQALKIINRKNLGLLVVKNFKNQTIGIVTDGDIKRANEKNDNINNLFVKQIMKKKPISVDKNTLAAKALAIMNSKKITSLCVYNKKNKLNTIGVVHIHNILNANIQ